MRASQPLMQSNHISRQVSKPKHFTPTRENSYQSEPRIKNDKNLNTELPDELKRKLGIEIGVKREPRNIDSRMPVIKEHNARAEQSNNKHNYTEQSSLNNIPENSSLILNEFNVKPKLVSHTSNDYQNEEMKSGQLSLMKARSDNQKANRANNKLFESDRLKPMKSEVSLGENKSDVAIPIPIEKIVDTKKNLVSMPSVKNFAKKSNIEHDKIKKITSSKGFDKEIVRREKPMVSTPNNETKTTDRMEISSTNKSTQGNDTKPKPTANKGEIDINMKNDIEISACLEEKIQGVIKMLDQIEKLKKIDLKPQKELFNKQLKVIIKKLNG